MIGAIVPWNTPLMISAWKIAPALAAGNTLVVKPPEDAPLSILHLATLLEEAGCPQASSTCCPGSARSRATQSSATPTSTRSASPAAPDVGRIIAKRAADTFKRTTLELGGKSPQIILADADLEAAINGTAMGLFFNQGEVCAAGTRMLVHRSLYSQVVDGLAAAAPRRSSATRSIRRPRWARW